VKLSVLTRWVRDAMLPSEMPAALVTTKVKGIGEPGNATSDPTPNVDTLPTELLLNILGNLRRKRDWLALGRTCRRLSSVAIPELDKYNAGEGNNFALWYACRRNSVHVFNHLVGLDSQTQNWINRHFTVSFYCRSRGAWLGKGMTPLNVAILGDKGEIMAVLLAFGADPNIPDNVALLTRPARWYPINYAVARATMESVVILRFLLKAGANPNQEPIVSTPVIMQSERQPTISRDGVESLGFQCAPIFRVLDVQEAVIRQSFRARQGTESDTYDSHLEAALDMRNRQLEILLEAGADPTLRHKLCQSQPLFYLLSRLDRYMPTFFYSPNAQTIDDINNQCRKVNKKVMSFLSTLRNYVDINELDMPIYSMPRCRERRHGIDLIPVTPLHFACELPDRHKPIVHWFLRNGASIDAPDRDGKTPLMAYCTSKFANTDQFMDFVRAGANVHARSNDGTTALHALCRNRMITGATKELAVIFLLCLGADPRMENDAGQRPVHMLEGDVYSARETIQLLSDAAWYRDQTNFRRRRALRAAAYHARRQQAHEYGDHENSGSNIRDDSVQNTPGDLLQERNQGNDRQGSSNWLINTANSTWCNGTWGNAQGDIARGNGELGSVTERGQAIHQDYDNGDLDGPERFSANSQETQPSDSNGNLAHEHEHENDPLGITMTADGGAQSQVMAKAAPEP